MNNLIQEQNQFILQRYPTAKITLLDTIKRNDAITKLREADIEEYSGLEITGYVEFKDFIFFCVLLTPIELRNKNLRKLEYILAKIKPGKIKFDNTGVIKAAKKKLEETNDLEQKVYITDQIARWYWDMKNYRQEKIYRNLYNKYLKELKVTT